MASGVPLVNLLNEKKLKLLFLDVGLVTRTTKLESELLLNEDILLINRGMIAEQLVGQELLAYSSPLEEACLYFWCRDTASSTAEVDFMTTVGSRIVPIEVKAGTTGRLRSLHLFMNEKKVDFGARVSQLPLSFNDKILSLPIYMVGELGRIMKGLQQI